MAVFTAVSAEALALFLRGYDLGVAVSFKGIAEGVQNSNYLLETTRGRFILTLYEERVETEYLPYFLDLLTHLADHALPVPRPIRDRTGVALQTLCGRPACLIEFLTGVSLGSPTADDSFAAGAALGQMHGAVADFTGVRPNALGREGWHRIAAACAGQLDEIDPGLDALIADELHHLDTAWPHQLDRTTIHADLFPDNVLMLGTRVTGLIDFYFACTDIRAYDLAVMHSAWSFAPDGSVFHADRAAALIAGYCSTHPLTDAEMAAMPTLCRGAALRFILTRAYDWINTPPDALVTRKDSLAFARRLDWYRHAAPDQVLGG